MSERERERCFLSSIRGGSKIHRTLTHTCFVKVYSKEENSDPLLSGVIVQVLNQGCMKLCMVLKLYILCFCSILKMFIVSNKVQLCKLDTLKNEK